MAVRRGEVEIVKILLDHISDFNLDTVTTTAAQVPGQALTSALSEACSTVNMQLAALLLERGANPNTSIIGAGWPLHYAVMESIPLTKLLLEHGADIGINNGDVFDTAVDQGKEMLELLLSSPGAADPVARKRYLNRSLQAAAFGCQPALCEWLLDEQGADVNCHGFPNGGPLRSALSNTSSNVANDQMLVVDLLITRGAEVNPRPLEPDDDQDEKPQFGYHAPLTLALMADNKILATRLIDAGADVNLVGGETHSPLQAAARHCSWMVPRLLELGANVGEVGGQHYPTALHCATYAQDLDTIELLLAHGADVNIISKTQGSLLDVASRATSFFIPFPHSRKRSVTVMKMLVDAGADVEAQYGSALHTAAGCGNIEALRWLLSQGVDVRVQGGPDGNAYQAALKKYQWTAVSYLEQHYGREGW
jgi:ankyrin repeat protein